MNYIIEDDIDFFKELNEDLKIDKVSDENVCLISNLPLTDNYITLKCNHKFNLLPLFNEVCKQKYTGISSIISAELCAGDLDVGGIDSCKGDSGGNHQTK